MTEYLVTDPCYLASHIDNLISDDDWKKFCDIMYKEFNTKKKVDIEGGRLFLSELTGLNILVLDKTDYGDWENSIEAKSKKVNIKSSNFMADAGLFCVVEKDAKFRKLIEENTNKVFGPIEHISASFETEYKPSELEFRVDHSLGDWAILKVLEKSTGSLLVTSSEEGEDECFNLLMTGFL